MTAKTRKRVKRPSSRPVEAPPSLHRRGQARPVARIVTRDRVCTSPLGDGHTHRAESCSRGARTAAGLTDPAEQAPHGRLWSAGTAVLPSPRESEGPAESVRRSPSESERQLHMECTTTIAPSYNRLPMGDLCKTGASHRTPMDRRHRAAHQRDTAPDGWGYSPLDQVHRDNVGGLAPRLDARPRLVAARGTPLVYDGIMYMPNPNDVMKALDVATGDPIWEHRRDVPDDVTDCFPAWSRSTASWPLRWRRPASTGTRRGRR